MDDYRKYACELTGNLFKEVHKKGVRRDKLSRELSISVNQIKNYAYDSTKSATLENFLRTMIEHKCETTLSQISHDMGYSIYRLPEVNGSKDTAQAACEAMEQASIAFRSALSHEASASEDILKAIEKLLALNKSL